MKARKKTMKNDISNAARIIAQDIRAHHDQYNGTDVDMTQVIGPVMLRGTTDKGNRMYDPSVCEKVMISMRLNKEQVEAISRFGNKTMSTQYFDIPDEEAHSELLGAFKWFFQEKKRLYKEAQEKVFSDFVMNKLKS